VSAPTGPKVMASNLPPLLQEIAFEEYWRGLTRAVNKPETAEAAHRGLMMKWQRDGKRVREIVEGITQCQKEQKDSDRSSALAAAHPAQEQWK
jgi:hypothetical protein